MIIMYDCNARFILHSLLLIFYSKVRLLIWSYIMKLTLDRMCLSTNDLCLKCLTKLKSGEVSNCDIQLGRVIIKASKRYKILKDITMEKVVLTNKAAYLIVKQGDKHKFDKAGYVFKNQLSDTIGTNIIILEKLKNVLSFIKKLLEPIIPHSTSTIFLPPDGKKAIKIAISKSEKEKIQFSAIELSKLLQGLYGTDAHYVFQ